MVRFRLFIAVALVLAAPAAVALACVCVGQTDDEYRRHADVVLAGTITARVEPPSGPIISTADPITWTFAVERVAKGTPATTLTVVSSRSGASCGFTFEVGRRYVVYAGRDGSSLTTSICSGTRELRAGEPPFALRRVAVYGFTGSRLSRTIGMARIDERPGPAALRILLSPRLRRDHHLASEIPPGTRLVSLRVTGSTARVVLSRRFATLAGRRLRRAVAQVVATSGDIPGVTRTRISTEIGPVPGFDRLLTAADFPGETG